MGSYPVTLTGPDGTTTGCFQGTTVKPMLVRYTCGPSCCDFSHYREVDKVGMVMSNGDFTRQISVDLTPEQQAQISRFLAEK